MHADEQIQHSLFVSPKCVKSFKFGNKRLLRNADTNDARIYASVTPKIHQGIWPDFCLKHLQDDPEGCSAWGEYQNEGLQLDFLVNGHSEAQVDRELINRVRHLSHFIPQRKQGNQKYCHYAYCPNCSQTVIRGLSYDEDNGYYDDYDVYHYSYYLVYRCGCTGKWWVNINCLSKEEYEICIKWQFCCAPTIYHGYFDWHHQTYFHHLESFLLYEKENPSCSCYWPQIDTSAQAISDYVYAQLEEDYETSNLEEVRSTFSPYLVERSRHGFLSGLLTHTFFYSQYRDILLDLDQHSFRELPTNDYLTVHNQIIDVEESIQQPFLKLYSQCLQKHPHPKIYYERGMVLFHQGDTVDSLEDIRKFIAFAEKNHYHDLLTSDLYLKEGRLLSECLSYDEAIVALTRAIERDSANKNAYFERAIAYFETGDFSKALSDYLASGIRPKKIDLKQVGRFNSITFGQGVALGMLKGGQDSVTEFVPSLLSCFRGISRGIWAFVSSPIESSQEMVDCAHACLEFIKDNTTKEMLCKLVPELQECLKKWDQLDDYTKGRYIGYVVGKYGVDIFIASGSVKAIQLYRNLRRANALMTLETASISPKLAQEVLEQAIKQEKVREAILKSGNLKVHWGQQGKHIPSKHNYIPGRSILEHPDPQKLIQNYAGGGRRVNHVLPGKPGYKEIVDFEEHIGIWKSKDGISSLPTTRGTIHYGKNGCHIIPAEPTGY
ncbi:MAG: tetratricopeptide repeat protein [Chlamydiia bacterium]|nr:tetratricopeptide repeat protein [Chlamydiia bacterium]